MNHWFTQILYLRTICAVVLLLMALGFNGYTYAQETPGIAVPEGQEVVTFAWAGESSLAVITQDGAGYSVYRVQLADSQWLPVSMPPSFTRLKVHSVNNLAVDIMLSKDGNGLAVLEHSPEPLIQPVLNVYRWTANGYRSVDTRQMPEGFWPAHLAWDELGQQLFISTREYLFPEQLYSIVTMYIVNGAFTNVMLKGNIDLVDDLVYIPQRQALGVKCCGFQGEYPQQPVIALIELEERTFFVLHSEATEHGMIALENGGLLVTGPIEISKTLNELWSLEKGEKSLRPAPIQDDADYTTLQMSRNGEWVGYISKKAQDGDNQAIPSGLVLQRISNAKTLVTAQSCAMFAFSLNSSYVCSLEDSRTSFTFYQLPDD